MHAFWLERKRKEKVKKMKMKILPIKIIVSLICLIVVISVVIGVNRKGDAEKAEEEQNNNLPEGMKAVKSFCQPTLYKDTCSISLEDVAKNIHSSSKDFLLAAIDAIVVELNKSIDSTNKVFVNKQADIYHYLALEECKELQSDSILLLQESHSLIVNNEMDTMPDHRKELLNWLSAVDAYRITCLDQLENRDYLFAVENATEDGRMLTDNAINIVSDISIILNSFYKRDQKAISRTLQELPHPHPHPQGPAAEYPSWFSVSDRKLLSAPPPKPHVTVAKDRTGDFRTISAAVEAYPKDHQGKYIIYVKAGVYNEQVIVDMKKPNVFIYGDGPGKTIVTGDKNYDQMKIPPSKTATFVAKGKGFIAKSMTFRNTAGPVGHRAVALRVQSDQSAFFDCIIEGYHDTLYYLALRQFYRNCVISGNQDFIFGMGSALIQNSLIVVRKPTDTKQNNTITADGKQVQRLNNGLVIQNCRIVPDRELAPLRFQIKTYLGRPWKAQATTVVMQTEIGDFIRPEGWLQWKGKRNHETCKYAEFDNRGPGASVDRRDQSFKKWRLLSPEQAELFTAGPFLNGYEWLNSTGVPFMLGFLVNNI